MKQIEIISKVVGRRNEGVPITSAGPSIDLGGYALKSELVSLNEKLNDFLEGEDADEVINKWKELEAFLNGISETNTLNSILGNYVTLNTPQTITGEKNFTGGLKVNGSPIYYDAEKKYWKLEGDLIVSGGVTTYANDSAFIPSTIMDAIVVDNVTIIKENGKLVALGGGGSGGGVADSVAWGNVLGKPSWITDTTPSIGICGTNVPLGGGISQSSLRSALGLGSNAYTSTEYLPLSGGTITTSSIALTINRTGALNSAIRYMIDGVEQGSLGFYKNLGLAYYDVNNVGWWKIWHENNDGSGSGLDADLLDGKHLSDILSSNVASATKLQTARTIWGRPFDGTNNVGGELTLANARAIVVTDTNGETMNGILFTTSNIFHLGSSTSINGYDTYLSGKNVHVKYGTSRTSGMILNSSGNVSIGSSDLAGSSQKLYVNGKSHFNESVSLKTSEYIGLNITSTFDGVTRLINGMNASLAEDITKGIGFVFGASASKYNSGNVHFRYAGKDSANNFVSIGLFSANNLLCVLGSGNVGIGTTSPSSKLHVIGDILATGGVTSYSQRSLKNIVDERGLSIEELATIKPTRYKWKDGRDDRIHIGGIADDVQKVLPEVVYKMSDGTLTMDYGNAAFAIASSLIKPMTDHEMEIQALKEKVKVLEQEIEILKWNIA